MQYLTCSVLPPLPAFPCLYVTVTVCMHPSVAPFERVLPLILGCEANRTKMKTPVPIIEVPIPFAGGLAFPLALPDLLQQYCGVHTDAAGAEVARSGEGNENFPKRWIGSRSRHFELAMHTK